MCKILHLGDARFESRRGHRLPSVFFVDFLSLSPGKFWDSTYNEAMLTSFYILYNSLPSCVHLRAIVYIFSGLHSHEI
jgi:hypothetical protein